MKKFLIERIGDRTVVLSDVNRDEPSKIELALQYNSLIDRAEAAEARAAQLQAERDTLAAELKRVKAQYNTLQEMYRADHDQRIRQEEQIKQLNSEIKYLRSTDHAADLAFERMAPIDWRDSYNDETPLGQALDGLGDEVEL